MRVKPADVEPRSCQPVGKKAADELGPGSHMPRPGLSEGHKAPLVTQGPRRGGMEPIFGGIQKLARIAKHTTKPLHDTDKLMKDRRYRFYCHDSPGRKANPATSLGKGAKRMMAEHATTEPRSGATPLNYAQPRKPEQTNAQIARSRTYRRNPSPGQRYPTCTELRHATRPAPIGQPKTATTWQRRAHATVRKQQQQPNRDQCEARLSNGGGMSGALAPNAG